MQSTLRTKLLVIVAIATTAVISIIVVSTLSSSLVAAELERVESEYLPLVELGPKLASDLAKLTRSYQDAVAAQDSEVLSAARIQADELLADLHDAGAAVDVTKVRATERAVEDYVALAGDVARRIIAGETGEKLVDAMATMQTRQKDAEAAIVAAGALDRSALKEAFAAAREAQSDAHDQRLFVGIGCLAAMLLGTWWLTRSVLRSLGNLDSGFARFGRGDFATPIPVVGGDELARAADRANDMAKSLERVALERERAQWLDAGHVGLLNELRGELGPEELASRALAFLAGYLRAPVAALYGVDAKKNLRLLASHAPATTEDGRGAPAMPLIFGPGEGLVGQAATREDIVVVPAPPSDYLRVRSALGESAPAALVMVPLVRAGHVRGVLELGLFAAYDERARDLLLGMRETLAIALDVSRASAETRVLLAETQEQARRLTRQDEELRAMNEELQTQQEELRQSNDELSQQAAELEEQRRALNERNAAVEDARKKLQQKNEELATVSNYKSQFLTNMSHELRTPLNSMLLLSNLLAENEMRNLSDKQVEYSRTIYSAGKDLLALINQVLDLAKVESGKQEIRFGPVRLRDVADRARRVFEPLAHDKGLALVVELAPDLPESMSTDQQRVDQILTNLLGNAIKFSADGSVSLRIARAPAGTAFTRRGLGDAPVIALAVCDSGPGIAPEDQERIFVPFEQLDAKTDRRYGGTGLGLPLTRELAELLGGEIQLMSTPGHGSTFTCYLPERPPRSATARVRAASGEQRPSVAKTPDGPWLLVIEDDTTFAQTFGEVIRGHGLELMIAPSGEEALRLARQVHQPSGIILDVKLPDTNGFELMEELRRDPRTADIPVHFVSAIDATERGLALGAVGYLVKPALRKDLVRVVESLVPIQSTRSCHILVIEDDHYTGESLLKMLAAEKLEAHSVKSAAEALRILSDRRFDCMILDLTLPDMDGLELLERIQREHSSEMPSVVVYTARALSRDEAKRLEAYTEAIVLKDGPSAERVLNEIRLFVRRLKQGLGPRRAVPPAPPPGDHALRGRKALVVDDDMRTVYALTAALRAKGMEVFTADNGRAALESLALRPAIDIVLMDIMMPEMDGYEAMRRIRAEQRFVELPIIALTAKAMKGDEEKCLQAGANAYMSKPIDASRLLGLMHSQLKMVDGA